MRLPERVGIIPDGNRRWAKGQGTDKLEGYVHGISPGMSLYRMCRELDVDKMSSYSFTADDTERSSVQRQAFTRACVVAVEEPAKGDADLLVLGSTKPSMLLQGLLPLTARHDFRRGGMEINFLVNYSWEWDLGHKDGTIGLGLKTSEVSRIDLIIRWGGKWRLSGFLSVQSVYSGFYAADDYWPDFKRGHVKDALKWCAAQDTTLGG